MANMRSLAKGLVPEGLKRARREAAYRKLAAMDPSGYPNVLRREYRKRLGRELDLEHPVTFNEKIQWMKLHDSTPEKGRLADKYLVREFVRDRIGDEYLVPLLGVWDDPDDIDFNALPDRFVLKATHGCGWNIIVRDKAALDVPATRKRLAGWLATDYAFVGSSLELHYHFCEPRIVAEAYLENVGEGGTADLYDYKFHCFGGGCSLVEVCSARADGMRTAFLDREWKRLEMSSGHPSTGAPAKPGNLERMLRLAEALANGFPYVRVDVYRMDDGRLYFGEMTFTHAGGFSRWDPPETDVRLGALVRLPRPTAFARQGVVAGRRAAR